MNRTRTTLIIAIGGLLGLGVSRFALRAFGSKSRAQRDSLDTKYEERAARSGYYSDSHLPDAA